MTEIKTQIEIMVGIITKTIEMNPVPDKVQHSFQQDYLTAQNPKWNNRNGQWQGAYKDKDIWNVDAHYDVGGQRIDNHIPESESPQGERDMVNIKYHPKYKSCDIGRPSSQILLQSSLRDGRNFIMTKMEEKQDMTFNIMLK